VIVLRYVEDLSYDEIAGLLGLPLGTVKAQIHRAHAQIRRRLAEAPGSSAEV
jgi:RNA polymerase sigma-70 factor (ECF subfamily)